MNQLVLLDTPNCIYIGIKVVTNELKFDSVISLLSLILEVCMSLLLILFDILGMVLQPTIRSPSILVFKMVSKTKE